MKVLCVVGFSGFVGFQKNTHSPAEKQGSDEVEHFFFTCSFTFPPKKQNASAFCPKRFNLKALEMKVPEKRSPSGLKREG